MQFERVDRELTLEKAHIPQNFTVAIEKQLGGVIVIFDHNLEGHYAVFLKEQDVQNFILALHSQYEMMAAMKELAANKTPIN